MKDLIAKLKSDACMAMGGIWLHIDAREARIAELEAENAKLRAGAQVVAKPVAWLSECIKGSRKRYFEISEPNEKATNPEYWTDAFPVYKALQAPVREVPDMRPGIEAVVALIQKQCDDYHREHGSQEPDTGVWNYPGDGNEWMCDREELLDEIRALLPAAPVQQDTTNQNKE